MGGSGRWKTEVRARNCDLVIRRHHSRTFHHTQGDEQQDLNTPKYRYLILSVDTVDFPVAIPPVRPTTLAGIRLGRMASENGV
jgi:hypothetical protein